MDRDAGQLVKLSLLVAAVVSVVLGVSLLFFSTGIVKTMGIEVIQPYLVLVPLTVFFLSAQQVAQQWLIRMRLFGATGRVSVFQALAVNFAHVLVGLYQPVGTALIWVSSLGKLLHAGLLSLAARRRGTANPPDDASPPAGLREVAQRYRDFAFFRAPQEFVTAASYSLPVIALAAFVNPAAAGLYTLCQSVLGLPSRLIGSSVGSVFYPRITAAAKQGEDISRLITRATLALFAIGVLPYLAVVLFGPRLFALVFGSEWLGAGEFARWLALVHLSTMVSRPAAQALPVLSAQRFSLILSTSTLVLRLAALLFGLVRLESAVHAIAMYSVVGVVANLTLFLAVKRFSNRFDSDSSAERFS